MPNLLPHLGRPRGNVRIRGIEFAAMVAEGWRTWPNETGGILLGTDQGNRTYVAHVIGPGPTANHERYAFQPDSDWQAKQVAEQWTLDPTIEYLGDWHTHPDGTTRFSPLDTATAKSIAEATTARQPQPIMIVLALNNDATCRAAAARMLGERLAPMTLSVHASH